MTEILVVLACTTQHGCTETSNAYYESNVQLQQAAKQLEHEAKDFAGPLTVNYILPPLLIVGGSTGNSKINNYFNLKYNRTFIELIFYKDF